MPFLSVLPRDVDTSAAYLCLHTSLRVTLNIFCVKSSRSLTTLHILRSIKHRYTLLLSGSWLSGTHKKTLEWCLQLLQISLMAAHLPTIAFSQQRLFIPSDCYDWSNPTEHLTLPDFPVQTPNAILSTGFPFPRPILFGTDPNNHHTFNQPYDAQPVRYGARQLIMAPRCTSSAATTSIPAQVQALGGQGHGLNKVYRSRESWTKIRDYGTSSTQHLLAHADPTITTIDGIQLGSRHANVMVPPLDDPIPRPGVDAWTPTTESPLSAPGRQARCIFSLRDHYDAQLWRPTTLVNSEPAIRGEFFYQFITPVNLWLDVHSFSLVVTIKITHRILFITFVVQVPLSSRRLPRSVAAVGSPGHPQPKARTHR